MLKQSLIIAIVLGITSLASWEMYWRSQGKIPDMDDDKNLWAVQRARVADANQQDVVIVGSSRILFAINIYDWERETGVRPIQLASAGSSPLPLFHDLVNNTDFKGTIVVGVTPGLFFSTTYPEAGPIKRSQQRVDYFKDRTYAQMANHWLSLPLQNNFVFISTSEEGWSDDIDLKSLLNSFNPPKSRTGKPQYPPFRAFSYMDTYRNNPMSEKTATDTAFANSIAATWKFIMMGDIPPPDREGTTKYFVADAQKFRARGGNLILVQCPSSGWIKEGESQFLPRAIFWDPLVKATKAKAYHYQDYPQFRNLTCPELSHLSAPDARFFTTDLVRIMKKDGALPNSKTK